MDFKEKALTTFLSNIKNKIPNLSQYELEVMKLAFSSGFNVGIAQDKDEQVKELALINLSI